jgi:hypothetical protein
MRVRIAERASDDGSIRRLRFAGARGQSSRRLRQLHGDLRLKMRFGIADSKVDALFRFTLSLIQKHALWQLVCLKRFLRCEQEGRMPPPLWV